MKRLLYILVFAVSALIAVTNTSCIEDDFTTSSNDLLEFSTDTVAFDTIFTQVGTATHRFTVYNRHSKMINISNIKVVGAEGSKFHINVDGLKGESFNNIEIRPKDSIYVFVEAYVDPTNAQNPIEIKDKIQFTTNNVEQNVVLTAWGQNVKREYNTTINQNTTFTADIPYVIFDTLKVAPNVTLTLEPGTTLYFHDRAMMNVEGKLSAIGTQEKPIQLRGDRLDKVVGQIPFELMSGQWGGVKFAENSYGNEMSYVLMRSSTFGVMLDSCDSQILKLKLFNSVLHNATHSTLKSVHSWFTSEGTEFSDAGGAVVSITGGKAEITHCTLANYYLFSAISSPILSLYNYMPSDIGNGSVLSADINNSIIYGNGADLNISDITGTNVYFRNTLLKSSGSDDSNFINCIWKGDPKYYTVREEYLFDYRLRNESDAIARGDKSLTPESLRYDRYGYDRFIRDGVDVGAYTWVQATEEEK